MNNIMWTEIEFEKGTGEFLKKACSLPDRIIPVLNGVAQIGDDCISVTGNLFKKLVATGCIESCKGGFHVTSTGVAFADK